MKKPRKLKTCGAFVGIGPGYRVYFTMRGGALVILLAGGDKRTHAADIKRARKLATEV